MTLILKADGTITNPRGTLPNIHDALGADYSAFDLALSDGAAISTWAPRGGDLTGWTLNGSGSTRPTLDADGVAAGVPAAKFDRTLLTLLETGGAEDLDLPLTVSVVAKVGSVGSGRGMFSGTTADTFGAWSSAGAASMASPVAAGGFETTPVIVANPAEWHVYSFVFEGDGHTPYCDGVTPGKESIPTVNGALARFPEFRLGDIPAGGRFDGWMAHIRVTRRAWNAAEVAAANTYFRNLYSLL